MERRIPINIVCSYFHERLQACNTISDAATNGYQGLCLQKFPCISNLSVEPRSPQLECVGLKQRWNSAPVPPLNVSSNDIVLHLKVNQRLAMHELEDNALKQVMHEGRASNASSDSVNPWECIILWLIHMSGVTRWTNWQWCSCTIDKIPPSYCHHDRDSRRQNPVNPQCYCLHLRMILLLNYISIV